MKFAGERLVGPKGFIPFLGDQHPERFGRVILKIFTVHFFHGR